MQITENSVNLDALGMSVGNICIQYRNFCLIERLSGVHLGYRSIEIVVNNASNRVLSLIKIADMAVYRDPYACPSYLHGYQAIDPIKPQQEEKIVTRPVPETEGVQSFAN